MSPLPVYSHSITLIRDMVERQAVKTACLSCMCMVSAQTRLAWCQEVVQWVDQTERSWSSKNINEVGCSEDRTICHWTLRAYTQKNPVSFYRSWSTIKSIAILPTPAVHWTPRHTAAISKHNVTVDQYTYWVECIERDYYIQICCSARKLWSLYKYTPDRHSLTHTDKHKHVPAARWYFKSTASAVYLHC
jgi:hypothetical protein